MATSPFANLFGPSPFAGLQRHMRVARAASAEVIPLFEAFCADDRSAMEACAERISDLESEADSIKHDIRAHLPRTIFTPVDRRDLLDILHSQDAIADVAEDIAGALVDRDMRVPAELHPTLTEFVAACDAVVGQGLEVIERFDELVSVGFSGRQVSQVEALLDALNTSEDHTDALERAFKRALAQHEDTLGPVTAIFWYRLADWIGDLADYAEKVANQLRLVIAR